MGFMNYIFFQTWFIYSRMNDEVKKASNMETLSPSNHIHRFTQQSVERTGFTNFSCLRDCIIFQLSSQRQRNIRSYYSTRRHQTSTDFCSLSFCSQTLSSWSCYSFYATNLYCNVSAKIFIYSKFQAQLRSTIEQLSRADQFRSTNKPNAAYKLRFFTCNDETNNS